MEKFFQEIGSVIRHMVDFFYPPFRRYVTLQFFRYGVIGVVNLLFDWVLYFLTYNYVLNQQVLNLGFVAISAHIATIGIKLPIVLISGFLMQKYVTFSLSELRGRIQLFRYMVVFVINLFICYIGLKLLVDYYGFFPSPSNMIISIFTIAVSYISQRYYTFKTKH